MFMLMNSHDIRRIRETLEMSQAGFADRLNVTEGTVRRWEDGSRHPKYDTMVELNKMARKAGLLPAESVKQKEAVG